MLAGIENPANRQGARLEMAWAADQQHLPVQSAYLCAGQVRAAYRQDTLGNGSSGGEVAGPAHR